MVKSIHSMAEFTALVKPAGNKLLVIHFTAKWSAPCRIIEPVFESIDDRSICVDLKAPLGLTKKFPGILLYKADMDDAKDVLEACGIKTMPTFHFYKNGQKIDELLGAEIPQLQALVAKHK